MTKVVISQPMYFPWPGFLAQLSMADVVIWLVDVQFSKGSFTNRVQIHMPKGMSWLTVPLERGGRQKIADLRRAKEDWVDDHIEILKQSLKGKEHLDRALDCVEGIRSFERVCDGLIASSEVLASALGIAGYERCLSSDLNVATTGSDRVLRLVKAVNGTRYITGHGARNYLDHTAFEAEGVAVDYMDYDVKPWEDDPSFTPYVTGLDLLAKTGPEAASYLNPKTLDWHKFIKTSSKD